MLLTKIRGENYNFGYRGKMVILVRMGERRGRGPSTYTPNMYPVWIHNGEKGKLGRCKTIKPCTNEPNDMPTYINIITNYKRKHKNITHIIMEKKS